MMLLMGKSREMVIAKSVVAGNTVEGGERVVVNSEVHEAHKG